MRLCFHYIAEVSGSLLDMGKYDGRCGRGGKLIEKKNCNKGGRCKKWEDQEMYIERKAAIPRKRW